MIIADVKVYLDFFCRILYNFKNVHKEKFMSKPNVIFILADDLSYCDLGCYGQTHIKTPNIDALAENGMRFTDFYSSAPICGPSRCGILTGKHMGHARIREHAQPVRGGRYQETLKACDYTLGNVFKEADYATACIGKWAVGLEGTDAIPNKKGFDYSFGFYDQNYAHTFYPEYVWENGKPFVLEQNKGFDMTKRYNYNYSRYDKVSPYDNEYGADGKVIIRELKDPTKAQNTYELCEEKAIKFIEDNCDKPFFLYYAIQNPHGPLIVPSLAPYTDSDFPSLRHKEWASIVTRLDTTVGIFEEMLKKLNIADNTLVIFTSDNGYSAWGYFGLKPTQEVPFFDHKGKMRGAKFTLDGDGGIRVPFIAKWSNRITPKEIDENPFAHYDLLATFAELIGVKIPEDTDGISILPTLLSCGQQARHEYLYWECNNQQALRIGNYKIFRANVRKRVEIYDVTKDSFEKHDLAKSMPDLVKKAKLIFLSARTDSDIFINPGERKFRRKKRLRKLNLVPNDMRADDPSRAKWLKYLE